MTSRTTPTPDSSQPPSPSNSVASSSAADNPWTDAQRTAIESRGRGLLVSAAAGSGKTATLSERVARLVCDPPTPPSRPPSPSVAGDGDDADGPCRLDQILVVTFTNNAAAEMRARIEKTLAARAGSCAPGKNADHARRQLLLVGRAQVSTIHAFCSRLIKRHFERLGVDPRFTTLQDEDATLLKQRVLRDLLDRAHTGKNASNFRALVDWLGRGDDNRVGELVLRLHELMGSVLDPAAWRTTALTRLEAAATDPRSSDLGREYERELARRVPELLRLCHDTMRLVADDFPQYDTYISDQILPIVHLWQAQLAADPWSLIPGPDKLKSLPGINGNPPGKDRAKKLMDKLKGAISDGPFPAGLVPDEAFWKTALTACLTPVRELLKLCAAWDDAYRKAKDERRCLDFADLERLALQLLTPSDDGTPSDVARTLHRQYRHVLVDECQDINAVQDRILSLTSTDALSARHATSALPSATRHPPSATARPTSDLPHPTSNLFSVGDVKQSIYRFRLAEPALFEKRLREYEADPARGQVVRLSANFRSRGPLLAVVNAVFSRLMVGGDTDVDYTAGKHELVEGRHTPPSSFPGAPAELHLLPRKPRQTNGAASAAPDPDEDTESPADDAAGSGTAGGGGGLGGLADDLDAIEREAEFIARRVRQLMGLVPGDDGALLHHTIFDPRSNAVRPLRFGDVAVLLRSAAVKAKQVASMLRLRGLPVHADVRGGLLAAREVTDVLALLDLLDNPDRDLPLATYLRSPLSLLAEPEEAMARARVAFPAEPFHAAIRLYADQKCDDCPYAAALRDAMHRVSAWRQLAARRPVADLLDDIYQRSFYPAFVTGLPDGEQRRANLLELLAHARSFSGDAGGGGASGGGGGSVGGFTAFLRAVEEQADLSAASVVPGSDDVVRVLTVHGSKGLEYPIVFLPDLGKKFNLGDLDADVLLGRDVFVAPKAIDAAKAALYPSPAWLLARARLRRASVAEELRVLYVAMTRAREHLILVATAPNKQNVEDLLPNALARHGPPNNPAPLPESTVLAANTPLDWLLPAHASALAAHASAIAARASDVADHVLPFTVRTWTEDDVKGWTSAHDVVHPETDTPADTTPADTTPSDADSDRATRPTDTSLTFAARLAPCPPALLRPPTPPATTGTPPPTTTAPAPSDPQAQADAVLARLAWTYPHADAARRRAAVSVTSLTHGDTHVGALEPTEAHLSPPTLNRSLPVVDAASDLDEYERQLLLPRQLVDSTAELAATERGTATHLALEYLDFSPALTDTPAALSAQIAAMVERKRLTPREAGAVDIASIRWLLESPLAPYLRGQHGPVHRELPVYLPPPPPTDAATDSAKDPATDSADPTAARTSPTDDAASHVATDPLDLQMIRGRIDVLIETPEGPVIIDYKTDHVWGERLEQRVAQYAQQVAFYRHAAKAITGRDAAAVHLAFLSASPRCIRTL